MKNSRKLKRNKLKIIVFFCGRKKNKKSNLLKKPISIHSNRGIATTVYPDGWRPLKEFKCSDGEIIKYNSIHNQLATDEALSKLKQDTIKGETIEKDSL